MKVINNNFKSSSEAKDFVLSCEKTFADILDRTAAEIVSDGSGIITVSGPTCSGKTTTSGYIVSRLRAENRNVVLLSLDDFFKDDIRKNTPPGEVPDFDSVDTLDLGYIEEFFSGLFEGKRVSIPHFNFISGKKDSFTSFDPCTDDVYVIEGIQTVYPEFTRLIPEKYTSIFLGIHEDVTVNDVLFESHTVRFLRRMVRDYMFRNASSKFTFECWGRVRENESVNIYPNSGDSDYIIDSFLGYELYAISEYAVPLLEMIERDSDFYQSSKELTDKLNSIRQDCLRTDFIPQDSVFREFIG